jgi:glycosyltransferase involved in cell wall biosynthesis
MPRKPEISVIMPVYNMMDTVSRSVRSVIDQSATNWELIIVDDASTDGTPHIVEEFRKADDRILLRRNTSNSRKGAVPWEPRNDGLQWVSAPLVAYLDADNFWSPHFLAAMSKVFHEDKRVQLCYCWSRNHYHDLSQLNDAVTKDRRRLIECDYLGKTAVFESRVTLTGRPGIDWYIDTNEIVHRSSVFPLIGGFWNVAHPNRDQINRSQAIRRPYRRHNDQDLVERIIQSCGIESVAGCPEILTNFFYSAAHFDEETDDAMHDL